MGRAQRRAVQESIHEFRDFMGATESIGTLRRSLDQEQQNLPAQELGHEGEILFHPKHIIDVKARAWHDLWAPHQTDEEIVQHTFQQ
eukprot:4640318-Pyramimonas_sp.AAC.1